MHRWGRMRSADRTTDHGAPPWRSSRQRPPSTREAGRGSSLNRNCRLSLGARKMGGSRRRSRAASRRPPNAHSRRVSELADNDLGQTSPSSGGGEGARRTAFWTCASRRTLLHSGSGPAERPPRIAQPTVSAQERAFASGARDCRWGGLPLDAVDFGLHGERIRNLGARRPRVHARRARESSGVSAGQRRREPGGGRRTANLKNLRKNFFSSRKPV